MQSLPELKWAVAFRQRTTWMEMQSELICEEQAGYLMAYARGLKQGVLFSPCSSAAG